MIPLSANVKRSPFTIWKEMKRHRSPYTMRYFVTRTNVKNFTLPTAKNHPPLLIQIQIVHLLQKMEIQNHLRRKKLPPQLLLVVLVMITMMMMVMVIISRHHPQPHPHHQLSPVFLFPLHHLVLIFLFSVMSLDSNVERSKLIGGKVGKPMN